MSEEQIPQAVWSGVFRVFGVEMKCHVLDNGQRIVDCESVDALFSYATSDDPGELEDFVRWQTSGIEVKE